MKRTTYDNKSAHYSFGTVSLVTLHPKTEFQHAPCGLFFPNAHIDITRKEASTIIRQARKEAKP